MPRQLPTIESLDSGVLILYIFPPQFKYCPMDYGIKSIYGFNYHSLLEILFSHTPPKEKLFQPSDYRVVDWLAAKLRLFLFRFSNSSHLIPSSSI